VLPLVTLDSARVVDNLKAMFPDPKNSGPLLGSDSVRNTVLVRGTAGQVAEVRAAIRAMGEGPASGNLQVIIWTEATAPPWPMFSKSFFSRFGRTIRCMLCRRSSIYVTGPAKS